jgi:hypothetical protein
MSRLREDWATKEQGFDSQQGKEVFLSSTKARPSMGPIQLLTQWVRGAVSPAREAYHSHSFSAQIQNVYCYISIPPYVLMATWPLSSQVGPRGSVVG